jgi:hypothetical protein
MTVTHQTHTPEEPGQTDSFYKLSRLKVPNDLEKKSVLDIGCNEGFFSNVASQRGAQSVVGIDVDKNFLDEAKRRYEREGVNFIQQSWENLPSGKYDLVFWTSTMHYELDPLSVIKQVSDRLTDDGLFILECGVIMNSDSKEMISNSRPDGSHWYPTMNLLKDFFVSAGLTYRIVSEGEVSGTDPVPRFVFHCHKRVPTVVFITGQSGVGKTVLAELLNVSANKLIKLDYVISRIAHFKYSHTNLHRLIKECYDPVDLSKIYIKIDQEGLTDEYIKFLLNNVCATDRLVIFEGFMTTYQLDCIRSYRGKLMSVWFVNRT